MGGKDTGIWGTGYERVQDGVLTREEEIDDERLPWCSA